MTRIQLAATWVLVSACGGDPFTGAIAVDGTAGDVLEHDQVDAGDELGDVVHWDTMIDADAGETPSRDSSAEHSQASTDAGAGDVLEHVEAASVDAPATCTPIASLAYPFACTTSVAGDCPNGSQDCLWNKFLCAAGSCCRLDPFPNPCHACRETFNCACLAPYVDGGMCCDSDAGPYLGFRCP